MRIIVAPTGTRGDFQPMLALAIALRDAGHDATLLTGPNFEAEARAFGVPVAPHGLDTEAYAKENRFEARPIRGTIELMKIGRRECARLIEEGLHHVRGADLIVGAGAQVAGPTIAELAKVPYAMVVYTPQALRSEHHSPFVIPLMGMPPVVNRVLWFASLAGIRTMFGGPINRKREQLGLAPVADWYEHFFPKDALVLACDPELAPLPPDVALRFPPTGALHLADQRPLEPVLERFLDAGPPPIYAGFGSVPDSSADRTTVTILRACRAVRSRLVLSRGWADLGREAIGDDVIVIGPSSHGRLFQRVRAIVHHGGAGTTSAAVRAGKPQIVVPHAFDQVGFGRRVEQAGLGPPPIARSKLDEASLTNALELVLHDTRMAERAEAMAAKVRARDPAKTLIAVLEEIATRARMA